MNMKGDSIKKICLGVITGAVLIAGTALLTGSKDMTEQLEQVMQDVYAPKSMEQFREGKERSLEIFEPQVANRMFVAYGTDLTAQDKQRVCETFVYHGRPENQKDGKERYLVKAFLYATKTSEPIKKNFVFRVGESGKIEDFSIQDMGGVEID